MSTHEIADQILRAWARLASPDWGAPPRAARHATPGVCAEHGPMVRYERSGRKTEYRCLACQREKYRQRRRKR